MNYQEQKMRQTQGIENAPLSGVRVLEFGHYAAGPFATMLLADWGADVVKVEPVDGEPMRHWPPLVGKDSDGTFGMNFAALNRNKRCVEIDLKDPAGVSRARELCKSADIILENFRPGVLKGLKLGFEDIVKINSDIVYCSVTGYGQTGPDRDKGAFDVAIQAASGIMSVTGEEGGPPAKCGLALADYGTGVFAALACVTALRRAEKTGEPGYVDVSMLSCMLSLANLQTSEYWGSGTVPKRLGSRHPKASPYQAYLGSDDKWFILAAGSDRLWHRVCDVIDASDLTDDPRFRTPGARAENQVELEGILEEIFSKSPASVWLQKFDAASVPAAAINDYAEALGSEHVRDGKLIHRMDLPDGGQTQTVGNPVRLSNFDFRIFHDPSDSGTHNEEVDAEWIGDGNGGSHSKSRMAG
ncbi:CoA transferase [uncultured Sneathiella sp.]|uniref:CaiB/BaiF CoA transferase family protein n=1 Tax=uncultured Sneathiella sp. TaxID=879315 RepID=UPI0030EF4BFB